MTTLALKSAGRCRAVVDSAQHGTLEAVFPRAHRVGSALHAYRGICSLYVGLFWVRLVGYGRR